MSSVWWSLPSVSAGREFEQGLEIVPLIDTSGSGDWAKRVRDLQQELRATEYGWAQHCLENVYNTGAHTADSLAELARLGHARLDAGW